MTGETMNGTTLISGIRTVSIPVDSQDDALRFYTETLGLEVLRDAPTPNGRWIELGVPGTEVILTLEPAVPGVTRGPIGIRFLAEDVDTTHAGMAAAGVAVDDILRWPGVPAMFAFRDPDGNAFSVTASA